LDLDLLNTPQRFLRTWLASIAGLAVLVASSRADEGQLLRVSGSKLALTVAVDLPQPVADASAAWELAEVGADSRLSVQVEPRLAADGTIAAPGGQLLAIIPPAQDSSAGRQFRLERAAAAGGPAASAFKLAVVNDKTLQVTERDKPVLAYNYGTITGANVPENDPRRNRACYLHPIWGFDGEVLTDDFPKDHYHHHGAFWAWPHVTVDGKEYDLWTSAGIEQRFVRWLHQEAGPIAAVIGVENGWFVGDRQVATERVWIRAYRAGERERSLDLEIYLVPLVPLSLQGAGGKSYGGLTVRFAVKREADATITVPAGKTTEDLYETPLEWADLTTQIAGAPNRSGGAVFVHPQHPNYPPTWLTRHYGPLCIGWPGVHARQYEPGQPHRLPYRIWLHGGDADVEQLKSQYAAFTAGAQAQWSGTPAP
jgi:hypothetical protein